MATRELPVPSFFNPAAADTMFQIKYQDLYKEGLMWAKAQGVKHAATDRKRICLMPIDCQNTFCLTSGELFVAGRSGRGAIDDNVRLCGYMYRNLGYLSEIAPTLDTHFLIQIFHTPFWEDENGNNPNPATIITDVDVERGRWKVSPRVAHATVGAGGYTWLQEYAQHYTRSLAKAGKYQLMVWPFHAMLGGLGHPLVSIVEEAVTFHAACRGTQVGYEVKGGNPLTENYSVLRPEVLDAHDGRAVAQKNARFIKKLLEFDAVVIAGQAMSHCVAWTIDDLLNEIVAQDPTLARKVYLLRDCTSPVVIPGVLDFTDAANEAFDRFANAGMHVVETTTPMRDWEGLGL